MYRPRYTSVALRSRGTLATESSVHSSLGLKPLRGSERHQARDALILDPATGMRRLPMAAVSKHFTGVALECVPLARYEEQPKKPRLRLSQLTGSVRGLKRALGKVFALAMVLELFAIVGPFFNQVVIARALYKRPKVLALDEATCHLDGENERALAQQFRNMELTRVIIAHRAETIAGAQRVVVLKAGQVFEVMRSVAARGHVEQADPRVHALSQPDD